MKRQRARTRRPRRGFFARLRRDVAGNVLLLTAALIFPMAGMVGGALDLSRLYLVKTRLQHACDAGALAGRRTMAGGAWNSNSEAVADQFFDANFTNHDYGSGEISRQFTQPAGGTTVKGVASTTVPMTLMRVFGETTRAVAVQCDSDMQMPNTDVMFVLDNTGSMACDPNGNNCYSGSSSKIYNLKNAVKCFYEVLAQVATNGNCSTTITGTGIPPGTQLRFGFVPYSTNVNIKDVGLAASDFATSWPYQSRQKYTVWSDWQTYNNSYYACSSVPANTSTTQYRTQNSGYSCIVQSRTYGNMWHYGKIALSLSGFSPSGSSVSLPIGDTSGNFGNRTVTWDGCTEEAAATTNINSMSPGQLAPALPDALFLRSSGSSLSTNQLQTADAYTTANYFNGVRSSLYFCPTAAKKLQTWTTSAFDNYVDSLSASGNTYHDVGMLWGGRLLSPEGIFASENAATPTGGQIQRNLIFMTDGDAQAAPCDYQQFGIAWWDRRTETNVGSASYCRYENSNLDDGVNSRLAALCTAVKAE
ncbi:MAG: TadE/TadG family type IV pilus assembly protein, partial [Sphingomonas sp.]